MAAHLQHMMAKHLQRGGGVSLTDKGYAFTEKPVPTREESEDDSFYPEYTGDRETDTIERRVAMGLSPDPED